MKNPRSPEQRTGELVRHRRVSRGYSQQELADAMSHLGFSWHQTTVAKTEAAERPIRVNELVALANVLGVEVSELVEEPVNVAGGRRIVEHLRAMSRLSEAELAVAEAEAERDAAKEQLAKVRAAGARIRKEGDVGEHREEG